MRIGLVLLNIFFILLVSCGEDNKPTDNVDREKGDQQIKITAKAIEDFDYTDYALSTEGEEAVANWEKYNELAIQIGYLKKADVSFFNGDKVLLKKFVDEFKAGIPDQLRTNPIVSRSIILETAMLRLRENLTLDNIDGRTKLLSVKEVLVAFSNLSYQINKKLERDVYDKIEPE